MMPPLITVVDYIPEKTDAEPTPPTIRTVYCIEDKQVGKGTVCTLSVLSSGPVTLASGTAGEPPEPETEPPKEPPPPLHRDRFNLDKEPERAKFARKAGTPVDDLLIVRDRVRVV